MKWNPSRNRDRVRACWDCATLHPSLRIELSLGVIGAGIMDLNIPTVIWSGVIAAAISLAGVILSNSSTTKRLRIQLGHDADEKIKDRLGVLRKEVYLQLFSDISTLQAHLGSLSAKDPTSPEFSAPIQSANQQLAKAQLVGGKEVMEISSELMARFTESLFKLMIAAKPLHELRTDISIATKFYDENLQKSQRAIHEMTEIRESGIPDHERMAALKKSAEWFQSQYNQYHADRMASWERYNSLQVDFVASVKNQIGYVAPIQARLLAAIKNEIGVPTDANALLNQIEENQDRMEKALKLVLAEFQVDSNE